MAVEADRTMISFHRYLLPSLCIRSFQVQLSKRREMSVSSVEDPEEISKVCLDEQLKRNSSQAIWPRIQVLCYPTAWSLLNAPPWKRSENQAPNSYTADNLG